MVVRLISINFVNLISKRTKASLRQAGPLSFTRGSLLSWIKCSPQPRVSTLGLFNNIMIRRKTIPITQDFNPTTPYNWTFDWGSIGEGISSGLSLIIVACQFLFLWTLWLLECHCHFLQKDFQWLPRYYLLFWKIKLNKVTSSWDICHIN